VFYSDAEYKRRFFLTRANADSTTKRLENNPDSLVGTYTRDTPTMLIYEDMMDYIAFDPLITKRLEEYRDLFEQLQEFDELYKAIVIQYRSKHSVKERR